MFTENQLLSLLKVQSNIGPAEFAEIFGEDRGRSLFQTFARESWNAISFMFNKINGEDRERFLAFINSKIEN